MDANDPRHGTTAGYQVHRKAGEPACPACLEAKRRSNDGYIRPQRTTRTCLDCGMKIHGTKRCQDCHVKTLEGKGRIRPCVWCGTGTVSGDRTCRDCARLANVPEPTEKEALPPGRWMNDHGVMRWLAAEAETKTYAAGKDVACEFCYAVADEPCVNAKGEVRQHHEKRAEEERKANEVSRLLLDALADKKATPRLSRSDLAKRGAA